MKRLLYEIRNRIRFILGFDRKQQELGDEIDFHIKEATEDLIRSGVSPREARQQAIRDFGHKDSVYENCRDNWGTRFLQELKRDIGYAIRGLIKTRSFTCIALVTLALSIGVNTSMFSVLNALIFHTPSYTEADSLVQVYRTTPQFGNSKHSIPDFIDFRNLSESFSHLSLYRDRRTSFSEAGKPAESLSGLVVSGDFFAGLGVQSELGRYITADDVQLGGEQVVVLSHSIWKHRFAEDPNIIGRSILLENESVTIIGVMPSSFDDPFIWNGVEIWRPYVFDEEDLDSRGGHGNYMIGRLKGNASIDQAHIEMTTHSAALSEKYPESNAENGISLVPFVRNAQDDSDRQLSLFSMGLALCILLIACVNLANLLFARNALRAKELAIRGALGATRVRLIRQSLTESLALSTAGGGLGLLIAFTCNHFLGTHSFLGNHTSTLTLDWRIAGFAFAIAALAAIFFGILPALLSSKTDINDALKQGARGTTASSHNKIQHGLIISEVALALVLLASAGFFLRGLERFHDRDIGWKAENLLTGRIGLPNANYPDRSDVVAFNEQLQSRLEAIPGVTNVSNSLSIPFYKFDWGQRYIVEGEPLPQPGVEPMRGVNGVTANYFETMGIVLLEGRTFSESDIEGPEKTIISEKMAKAHWPNQSAIGKRIAHPAAPGDWQEIIGVVSDVRFASNLERTNESFQSYRFFPRVAWSINYIVIRTAVPPSTLEKSVREAVASIDSSLPINDLRPAVLTIANNTSQYTLTGWVLAAFASLGLLLAAVGLYGMLSGYVAQRTSEIGIRMAFGAKKQQVLHFVVGKGLRLVSIGILIGLVGCWGVAKLIPTIIPTLTAPEPYITASITLLLFLTSLFACWFPAKRAVDVDPMTSLRAE